MVSLPSASEALVFYFGSGSEFGSQETSCACNCGNLVVLEAF